MADTQYIDTDGDDDPKETKPGRKWSRGYRTCSTFILDGRLPDFYETIVRLNAAAEKAGTSLSQTARELLDYAFERCSKLTAADVDAARRRLETNLR